MDCGADLKLGDEKTPDGAVSASNKSNSKPYLAPSSTTSSITMTESPAKPVPLDVRAQFGANLFLLSGVELAHVILKLEQECPETLEHLREVTDSNDNNKAIDPPRLEINIDAIPAPLFEELSSYVEARVGTRANEPVKMEEAARPKKKKKT